MSPKPRVTSNGDAKGDDTVSASWAEDAQRGGSQPYSAGLRNNLRVQQESGARAQFLALRSVSVRAMVSIAPEALLSGSLRPKC